MNIRKIITITVALYLSACTSVSDNHSESPVDPIPQAKVDCLPSGTGKENENCSLDTIFNPGSL